MTTPPPSTNGPVIAGYFSNWQDSYADKEIHFPANECIDGKADSWDDQGNNLYGNFKQFYLLKQRYRHLKVSISIGGWTWSKNFGGVVCDSEKRQRFVESSVKLVSDFGLDGIDIDWEYPKNDKEALHYVHLLYDIRIALDKYQEECGQLSQPRLLLTVAVPCGPENYRKLRLADMEPYVDLFYLMAYDYAGSWDEKTGHQAAMFGGALNTEQAVNDYLKFVPSRKLVVGLPMYGRGFSDTDGPDSPYNGVPKGTWEEGQFDYRDLPKPGATEYYDHQKIASWSYDSNTREFISYDNPQAIAAKCNYVQQRQLGGCMFWELSGDQHHHNPRNLVNTVYRSFDGQIDQITNHLDYPKSQFDNLRNYMK
ncbi:Endochitinase B [Choanephora cucurbitarum]|uniref:chitinase n=1 Tax=Choanephora cucurbitarum TaxID=101091 RepID=A0A1C7NRP0_9FUNG|nr:Endochitinase B [Choanephora cucurbitarum]